MNSSKHGSVNQSKIEHNKSQMDKVEKIKQKELTLEEQIMMEEIKPVEKTRLEAVFHLFLAQDPTVKDCFGGKNIYSILEKLNYKPARDEVENMLWEVDEDLDGYVSWYEFELMFKRCIADKTGLEPRNLSNLVQFLMYDQHQKGKITVEDTLELLYVRCGRFNLDEEIFKIFGSDEKTADGQEKEITYQEYLGQMKKKDFNNRVDLEKKRKVLHPEDNKKND